MVIRGKHIKLATILSLKPIRMIEVKRLTIPNVGKNVEGLKLTNIADWNVLPNQLIVEMKEQNFRYHTVNQRLNKDSNFGF